MKVKADVDEVAHKSDRKQEIKPNTVINEEGRKLFDDNGKLIDVNHKETPSTPSKKSSKTTRPWKYNTPTRELVTLLEQYKKTNDPLLDELTAFIERRRARWKKFYENNKDRYKQWSSNWRKNNPDKVKASQQRYQAKKAKKSPQKSK